MSFRIQWGLFSFHRTVRNWCQSKGLVFLWPQLGGQLCWCMRRREIDGKCGREVFSTGISRRAYGESHWLSFQSAIFDPSRNESKGDKFHWEKPNFEVQIAFVQEISPFLAPDLKSRMTSPIENLDFPRLIPPKLRQDSQEKSCPPGFPIIMGSSFK